jgi:hypothetical protein
MILAISLARCLVTIVVGRILFGHAGGRRFG